MNSAPCAKFTTVISPKIRDRPMASRTYTIPSTRPVKTCARSVESSGTGLGEALLGAGAVVLLVRAHLGDDVHQAPVALDLVPALDDPEVLERLVVAGPPPLLALEVVVGRVLPERVGDRLRVGGLGQLGAAGHLEHAAVGVGAVVTGREIELLHRRVDELLGGGDGVLQLPVPVDR